MSKFHLRKQTARIGVFEGPNRYTTPDRQFLTRHMIRCKLPTRHGGVGLSRAEEGAMSMQLRAVRLSVVLLSVFLFCPASASIVHEYTEDLTDKEFCDELVTSAWWDTDAGELKLYPFQLSLVGECATAGAPHHVALAGDYAYVADGAGGLLVVSVIDPANPTPAGTCLTPDDALFVALAGDYAYVAGGTAGLFVIDISDPTDPTMAGGCSLEGLFAAFLAVAGDYVFVGTQDGYLVVVDISDPTNPTPVEGYGEADEYLGLAIAGDYIYAALGYEGVEVIDITDPTNPQGAGWFPTDGYARHIAVAGDCAYVADGEGGFLVADITDPTDPFAIGGCEHPWAAYVALSGDYAYVGTTTGDAGCLYAIDISTPQEPVVVESYETGNKMWGIAVAGDNVYAADFDGSLLVVNVADPVVPPVCRGESGTPGDAHDVAVSGDHVFIADGVSGLQVVDIVDPRNPLLVGGVSTLDEACGVSVSGDYAYVANGASCLQVVDISDPESPVLAGSCDTPEPGVAHDVAVAGDYAYLAEGAAGFQVIDISDPTNPTPVAGCATLDDARCVAVAGDYAFVGAGGFLSFDISDPTGPAPVGAFVPPGATAYDIALSGDHAFVVCQPLGLQVVSIADPTNPILAGSCPIPGSVLSVAIAGDYAFIGAEYASIYVVDITYPTSPVLLGSCGTPGDSRGIDIAGDYLYVADGGSGLQVLEAFRRLFDVESNVGQSLMVNEHHGEVTHARLMTTHADSVLWKLSADGGNAWDETSPDYLWHEFSSPGTSLVWQSNHIYLGLRENPIAYDLGIDWLYDTPIIDSVLDIPNDQGRWVRIGWTRSGNDFIGRPDQVTEYAIYRRIDEGGPDGGCALATNDGADRTSGVAREPRLDGSPLYPPGDWDFIMTVPARAEDEYYAVVPTLVDSTKLWGMHYTVLFVSALTATPGIYFDSPPDSGYSVDNLPPSAPEGFAVDYHHAGDGCLLTWYPCPDADFLHFRIYRSTTEGFEPSPENLVHTTPEHSWLDAEGTGWDYYKISSADFSGNESEAVPPEVVTGADEPIVPTSYALYQNAPNPVNPTTTIRYDVPSGGGEVTLAVFDLSGRLVRTLAHACDTPGRKAVVWDGKDAQGKSVASGVYYVRLRAPGYERTLKVTVLR